MIQLDFGYCAKLLNRQNLFIVISKALPFHTDKCDELFWLRIGICNMKTTNYDIPQTVSREIMRKSIRIYSCVERRMHHSLNVTGTTEL